MNLMSGLPDATDAEAVDYSKACKDLVGVLLELF